MMLIKELKIRSIIRKILISEATSVRQSIGASYDRFFDDDFDPDDDDDPELDDEVNYEPSTSVSSNYSERCVELGKATGIDPAIIYAIETIESNHNPNVFAWNKHICFDPSRYKVPSVSDRVPSKEEKNKINAAITAAGATPGTSAKPGGNSYYGSNAKKAYNATSKINAHAAITGGAWGLYQVLGAYTLPSYNHDTDAWKSAWESNSEEFSKKSFITWCKHPSKSEFKKEANASNYSKITELYFGGPNSDYTRKLKINAEKYREGQKKKPKKSSPGGKGKSSWKGKLGSVTAGGINFHELKDRKNNYRAGIKADHTNPTVEFFKELAKPKSEGGYGIKNVITLNADMKKASENARKAGMKTLYLPSNDDGGALRIASKSKEGTRNNFDKIKRMLKSGNTLIHCTHGADRTGGTVGRYYVEEKISGVDTKEKALADAYQYKSGGKGKFMASIADFINFGPEGKQGK